jgi:uncharacterized protein
VSLDAAPAMTARIRADLKAAMLARKPAVAAVLRTLIATIDNAQAVPLDPADKAPDRLAFGAAREVARTPLGDADLRTIITQEIAEREAAARAMAASGYPARADQLRAEAAMIAHYLTD